MFGYRALLDGLDSPPNAIVEPSGVELDSILHRRELAASVIIQTEWSPPAEVNPPDVSPLPPCGRLRVRGHRLGRTLAERRRCLPAGVSVAGG